MVSVYSDVKLLTSQTLGLNNSFCVCKFLQSESYPPHEVRVTGSSHTPARTLAHTNTQISKTLNEAHPVVTLVSHKRWHHSMQIHLCLWRGVYEMSSWLMFHCTHGTSWPRYRMFCFHFVFFLLNFMWIKVSLNILWGLKALLASPPYSSHQQTQYNSLQCSLQEPVPPPLLSSVLPPSHLQYSERETQLHISYRKKNTRHVLRYFFLQDISLIANNQIDFSFY